MSSVTVKVAGLAELKTAMTAFSDRLDRRACVIGLSAACGVIKAEAVARAAKYAGKVAKGHPPPGTLKKAIVIKRDAAASGKGRIAYRIAVKAGPKAGKRDAFYWWMLEFGLPHNHMPAKPFMRPAFDAKAADAVNRFVDKAREELQKAGLK